ncbi:MAG: MliC family protein [Alphaproteobacteria bacterium]|nr:MliC family protein [Alphaproteobacteria bacterium]
MKRLIASFALVFAAALPAEGAGIGLTLMLDTPGEWRHTAYTCDGREAQLSVAYVNAAPNFLALVPIDGETLVFASIVAGSGARYAAGRYEWRTDGVEAMLIDTIAEPDAPPLLTCLEANEIP